MRRLLWSTAIHEAAHAVADITFGHDFGIVTIIPSNGNAGVSQAVESWEDEDGARKWIISLLAGQAAEMRAGLQTGERIRFGASSDRREVRRVLQFTEWTMREAEQATARFVYRNWRQIRAVAKELFKYRKLDQFEIEMILAGELTDLAQYRINRAIALPKEWKPMLCG